MTEKIYLRNEILKLLSEKLSFHGFKLSKSLGEFTQITDFGWNKYQLVFLIRESGWEIKPCLMVRFNVVENLFHQVSEFETKHQKGTLRCIETAVHAELIIF